MFFRRYAGLDGGLAASAFTPEGVVSGLKAMRANPAAITARPKTEIGVPSHVSSWSAMIHRGAEQADIAGASRDQRGAIECQVAALPALTGIPQSIDDDVEAWGA